MSRIKRNHSRGNAAPQSAANLIKDGSTAVRNIAPDPARPLAFAIGMPEFIKPTVFLRRMSNETPPNIALVGVLKSEKCRFATPGARSTGHAVNPHDEKFSGGRAAIRGETPDPLDPLALSVGSPGVITRRAVADEIIERHLNAGLTDCAGQLQAAYILGISPEEIDTLAACAAVLYGVIPRRVTRQGHANNAASGSPRGVQQPASSNLARQRMKQAVDIQIAIIGSVVARRPDLYWLFEALMGLSDGLTELEAGFTPPALTRRPRSANAPRETPYEKILKANSVLAWAALVRIGMKKGEAKEAVARHLNTGKFIRSK
jgi:hypothetical protein